MFASMSRLRAFLAVVLVATWCSAAWHAELEVLGMLLEHEHHGHVHDAGDQPAGPVEEHTELVAQHLAKDQVRVGSQLTVWFGFLGLVAWLAAAVPFKLVARTRVCVRRETGPPLATAWHFLQRCAPDSAAPPALS